MVEAHHCHGGTKKTPPELGGGVIAVYSYLDHVGMTKLILLYSYYTVEVMLMLICKGDLRYKLHRLNTFNNNK